MTPSLIVLPISPSSPFDETEAATGLSLLRSRGLQVLEQSERKDFLPYYLNGNDNHRLTELQNAIDNQNCDLIWATRGGYGLTRIISRLKTASVKTPVAVGFSDTSALLLHLWATQRSKSIHASTLTRLPQLDTDSLDSLFAVFSGHATSVNWPLLRKLSWPDHLRAVEGTIIAANLCVLTHLVGTPSMPSLKDCILVIEEVGERPYRIDRMLTQLWESGSFHGVKAILLGHFSSCGSSDQEVTAEAVVIERCKSFGIPLCAGLPVGHESSNWAIPFGVQASLTAGDQVQLKILEELF